MSTSKNNEPRYVGTNWDPTVNVQSGGVDGYVKKKVLTNGIKRIPAVLMLAECEKFLRQGYEVRLTDGLGYDAIRLFPFMLTDLKTMRVKAETMGDFLRDTFADKKATLTHDSKPINREKYLAERKKVAEEYKSVTPDKIINCWRCGAPNRVGKKLQ